MQVLAFGSLNDRQAWNVVDKIKREFPDYEFHKSSDVDDILKFKRDMIIIDVVKGIRKPRLLKVDDLRDRKIDTIHDFDLGFFLKLLKSIDKINRIKIIGIPMEIDDEVIYGVLFTKSVASIACLLSRAAKLPAFPFM